MATIESKVMSDVMMEFVNRGIWDKEQLGDMSKGDLVKMMYKIANLCDYWEFVEVSDLRNDK